MLAARTRLREEERGERANRKRERARSRNDRREREEIGPGLESWAGKGAPGIVSRRGTGGEGRGGGVRSRDGANTFRDLVDSW